MPSIGGTWRYSEEQYGVVIQLPRERFGDVQTFLRHTFGPPAHEPSETMSGGRLGWYAAKLRSMRINIGAPDLQP
jgi:hypothetical protein